MTFISPKRRQTIVSSKKRRNRRLPGNRIQRCVLIVSGTAVFILIICVLISLFWQKEQDRERKNKILPQITIQAKLLDKNKYSRPGIPLEKVRGVVIHYTANPGTDAIDNRNYFNNLPRTNEGKKNKTYASSHFVIGLEGQIVQCIPLEEMSYASNERNPDTISIECCHPDKSGKFNRATYQSLLELTAYLCIKFDLDEGDLLRHYDVTGKLCPLYFVEHEAEWEKFRRQIKERLQ